MRTARARQCSGPVATNGTPLPNRRHAGMRMPSARRSRRRVRLFIRTRSDSPREWRNHRRQRDGFDLVPRCHALPPKLGRPQRVPTAPAQFAFGFPKVNIASVARKGMVMHQAGCVANAGPASRHHAVRDALIGLMARAGHLCKREGGVGTTGEGDNGLVLRMGIVATPPAVR